MADAGGNSTSRDAPIEVELGVWRTAAGVRKLVYFTERSELWLVGEFDDAGFDTLVLTAADGHRVAALLYEAGYSGRLKTLHDGVTLLELAARISTERPRFPYRTMEGLIRDLFGKQAIDDGTILDGNLIADRTFPFHNAFFNDSTGLAWLSGDGHGEIVVLGKWGSPEKFVAATITDGDRTARQTCALARSNQKGRFRTGPDVVVPEPTAAAHDSLRERSPSQATGTTTIPQWAESAIASAVANGVVSGHAIFTERRIGRPNRTVSYDFGADVVTEAPGIVEAAQATALTQALRETLATTVPSVTDRVGGDVERDCGNNLGSAMTFARNGTRVGAFEMVSITAPTGKIVPGQQRAIATTPFGATLHIREYGGKEPGELRISAGSSVAAIRARQFGWTAQGDRWRSSASSDDTGPVAVHEATLTTDPWTFPAAEPLLRAAADAAIDIDVLL